MWKRDLHIPFKSHYVKSRPRFIRTVPINGKSMEPSVTEAHNRVEIVKIYHDSKRTVVRTIMIVHTIPRTFNWQYHSRLLRMDFKYMSWNKVWLLQMTMGIRFCNGTYENIAKIPEEWCELLFSSFSTIITYGVSKMLGRCFCDSLCL